jgi:hypothetical protein
MELFDFVGDDCHAQCFDTMPFGKGEKVYDVAYRAYRKVMEHRKMQPLPPEEPPSPNDLRLAFPPST